MIRSDSAPQRTLVGRIAAVVAGLVMILGSAAAQEAPRTKITISGSDTMNLLSTALAENYRDRNPDVEISVTGGGTGRGISDLINSLSDIAQASREMSPEEVAQAKGAGLDPQAYVVALDGLAVIVNEKNPITELSKPQIAAIFTGAVTNWKDFGGPDRRIVLYARESNSGTYNYFKDHVLKKKDFAKGANYLAATAAIGSAVAQDEGGVGFGGIGYFAHAKGVRVLSVREKKGDPAVNPLDPKTNHVNYAAIQDGSYPISRPLHFYTARKVDGEVRKFLDWILSPEGQKVVANTEYIPVLNKKAEAKAEEPTAEPKHEAKPAA